MHEITILLSIHKSSFCVLELEICDIAPIQKKIICHNKPWFMKTKNSKSKISLFSFIGKSKLTVGLELTLNSMQPYFSLQHIFRVKFIYSEKATKFCQISTLLLTVCTVVKSKLEISQNFVAFSEYMNIDR